MEIRKIPDGELEIMQALWHNPAPISTTTIQDLVNEAHTHNERVSLLATVTTLLGRLTARGFVSSVKDGKTRYYKPLVEEDKYLAFINTNFLDRLNQNSLKRFLGTLSQTREITEKDLSDLREFIKEKESK